MSLTINLEIGHEASLRTKNTPEGFTHDWKIFVRGCDGANIHYYIEKVVFHLHETFQKPKRVIKEPPYAVKESGYAGFIIPIEIYLRNSGEPKKIKFSYDLSLQRTGPPLRKIKKEKYFFTSPPDDFKEKLLKGGAVVTSSSQEISENKSILHEEKNQLISKPKLSGEVPTKKKVDPMFNSFQDLFGTPITKTSKAPEPKATISSSKENKNSAKPEKDKGSDKMKSKHSPQKEKEREREKSEKKEKKEEKKKDKERRDKDRERSREKVLKMERSPKMGSPSPKNHSPKSSSPVPQSSQMASGDKYRDKEIKSEKDKKDKGEDEEKRTKKEKKDKDSSRDREKHRDSSRSDSKNKEPKIKEPSHIQESDISSHLPAASETFSVKQEKKESHKDEEKQRTDKTEKSEEKKHKHKKRDKNKKDRKDKEEKSSKSLKKSEKERSSVNPQSQSVSNNSSTSTDVEMSETTNLFGNSPKVEPTSPPPSPKEPEKPAPKTYAALSDEHSDSSVSSRGASPMHEEVERERRSSENDSEKKRKRGSDSSDMEEPPMKLNKEEENGGASGEENLSDVEEQSDDNMENSEAVEEDLSNLPFAEEDTEECDEYCEMDEDTYNTLHDLKQRIMLIDNNEELQKVVDVISDTGLYEVSQRTFDFDLRQLDADTINQLLEILPKPQPKEDTS